MFASATLGLLVVILALAVMLSYATPNLGVYGWFEHTTMGMHTAMLFAMLGLAVMAGSWQPEVLPWSLGRNVTLAFACGVALLVAIGLITNRSQFWVSVSIHRLEQREIMMGSFYRAMAEITRLQSHSRGYLFTGDERFVKGYLSTKANYNVAMGALRRLIADSPYLQQDVGRFEAQTHEVLQWSSQTIATGRIGMTDTDRRMIVSHGEDLMGKLDATFDQIYHSDLQRDAQLKQELEDMAAGVKISVKWVV
jgi:CHASE3 domain sensor protein